MKCFERSCIDNKYWNNQHLHDVLFGVDYRLSNICANWKMGTFSLKVIYQNMLIFCAKTLQAYVETFALNNDISTISVHWVELDLCSIKVGCHFFGDTLYGQHYTKGLNCLKEVWRNRHLGPNIIWGSGNGYYEHTVLVLSKLKK